MELNKESKLKAIQNLKWKEDSDGEELSVITSRKQICLIYIEQDEIKITNNDTFILDEADEADMLEAVAQLNTE